MPRTARTPRIVEKLAKYSLTCSGCGERVRACERIVVVQGVRGENYCCRCRSLAEENNPDALIKVEGDNRWFAQTANGLRAGVEHTGVRCEDAPCCGCC